MSFIITVNTNEGIVMASDSRTTGNKTITMPDMSRKTQIGLQLTDATYKTFLCQNRIGISTCGDAYIKDRPIAYYIQYFIDNYTNEKSTVYEVADKLLKYFKTIPLNLKTMFIVAGYAPNKFEKYICEIDVKKDNINTLDESKCGAIWNGETDIFSRLTQNVSVKDSNGNDLSMLPQYNIVYNYFTLQDAIDFAEYAIDVTIKTMSFQNRVRTVGGPIDILAIKPDGAFWVKRKELHA